jgi:ribonuclease P protein component
MQKSKVLIIKKRQDILKAKNYILSTQSRYFNIKYNFCSCPCVLIVNTKRNCKTSVGRNKLKRRIKEIIRKTNFSFSLLIYSRPIAFTEEFSLIKTSLQTSIQQIQEAINKEVKV